MAALPDRLLATTVGPAAELVVIDRAGHVLSLGIRLDAPAETVCQLALSPGYHPGFPEAAVLVSEGPEVSRVWLETGEMVALASLPAEDGNVAGMCFDSLGGFGYFPLVLAEDGCVYLLEASGALLRVGNVGAGGRSPSVASRYSGAYAGQLLVSFPASGDVVAFSPSGRAARVTGWSGVSGAYAVPEAPLALEGGNAAFFVAVNSGDTGNIYECTLADVAPHPGALLLTSLFASGSGLVSLQYGAMTVSSWSRFMGEEVAATFVQRPAIAHIGVDVNPGSADDIVLGSTAAVAVALLSSPEAVPSMVDASTVTLAGAPALPSHKRTPGLVDDLNGDGTPDLVLSFRPADMQLVTGPMTLALEGSFFEGARLHGDARVRVLLPLNARPSRAAIAVHAP